MDIAVLYKGLKLKRVKWYEKKTLRKDNVIAISICTLDRRYQASIEHDYYQLIWTDTDCCLTGHDGDYGFFNFNDPKKIDWRFPFIMPENSIEFLGVYVSKEEYAKAKLIYADPDGGMF